MASFWLASCALLFPDRTAPKSASYNVSRLEEPWEKVPVSENNVETDALRADLAYENKKTGAIISLNSICRKYNHYSLQELTNNLVRDIDKKSVLKQEERDMDGGNALDTIFEGMVDGVKVNIRTVVLIKSECTYDFLHVVVPKKSQGLDPEFDRFLASFKAE